MKKRIGLLITSVLFFGSCDENNPPELQNETLSLFGRVESSSSVGLVTIGADYTQALPVAFARLDNGASYAGVNSALLATRLGGASVTEIQLNNSPSNQLNKPQPFQPTASADDVVRLVGWYPAVLPSSGVLRFDISGGATDVLLTQELAGTSGGSFCTETNPFLFRHRLCQLVVSVTATSEATVAKWGEIISVRIKNLPETYVVALPGTCSVSGTTDVVLNKRGGAEKMSPVSLSVDNYVECGYVLTAPSGSALTVELTGRSGECRTVEAPLPEGEVFRAGSLYRLRLNLDGLQPVKGALTASGWADEVDLDVEF